MSHCKVLIFFLGFFFIPALAFSIEELTLQQAIDAEKVGDHKKALAIYTNLADKGDATSMNIVGVKYYNGEGVTQDYKKAMNWWLKAFGASDGDAPGNIGVLYRDGKGVKQNRKISYILFLATHMNGLGSQDTQIRVNSLLRREVAELPQGEIEEALCYTWEYVLTYIRAKGKLQIIPNDVLPSAGKICLKDNNWWMDSEKDKMNFTCKPPWN